MPTVSTMQLRKRKTKMQFTFNPIDCAEDERKRIKKKIDALREKVDATKKENNAIMTLAKFFTQNVKLPVSNPNRIKEDDLKIVSDYLLNKSMEIDQNMNTIDIEEIKIEAKMDKLKEFLKDGE